MEIKIITETIKLSQLLKYSGVTMSGAEAKIMIKQGDVKVNNIIETAPGRQISYNDIVEIGQNKIIIKK